MIGLHLALPEGAIALSIDEKSLCQALDQTQPVLPMRPGIPAQMTHDYIRLGATRLFTALEVAADKGLDACYPATGTRNFSSSSKRSPPITAPTRTSCWTTTAPTNIPKSRHGWRRTRGSPYFTPTGCSWLNMVDLFFGIITRQAIRGDPFTSVKSLVAAIGRFVDGVERMLRAILLGQRHRRDPSKSQIERNLPRR